MNLSRCGSTLVAFGIVGLVACPLRAASEATPEAPLRLDDAVAQALHSYPELAAARARVREAQAAAAEARADHGPRLFATMAGTRYGQPVPVTPIHGFGPNLFPAFDTTLVQGGLQASYTLFDSGRRRFKLAAARAQIDAAEATLDANQQSVASRVAALYVEVLADRAALDAQNQRIAALGAERQRVEQLLAVGKAPEVDRLRAEAELASAQADAAHAGAALDGAERELARAIGVDPERARAAELVEPAAPAAPALPLEVLEAAAVRASPAVARARAAESGAEARRSLERNAYFPKLKASGAYQELGGSELAFESDWDVGLQLTVPLWDGGVTDARVAQARAAIDESRESLRQAELDAAGAVDRAHVGWTDAAARTEALTRAEARLAEVARVQKLLLDVGSGTQIDYLAAESQLASTRAALARSRGGAVAARIELARATGELTLDWLVRNLENRR